MDSRRLSSVLLTALALLLPSAVDAQQERQARAGLPADGVERISERMTGVRPKSTAATASCNTAKGTLTLGQAVHPYLGDSGSCFSDGGWFDFWVFTATAGTTLRLTYSSEAASLAVFQDFSTGEVLASSGDSCGGLATACTYDYQILTSGQAVIGFGSFSTQNYNLTLSAVTGAVGVNLAPYKPSGWSDRIVVSTTTGAHVDGTAFHPGDALYVDWAVINSGTIARPPVNKSATLFVDGTAVASWVSASPLDAGSYGYVEDYSIGTLSAGTHTLRLEADPDDEVPESSESDNEYSRTITVSPGGAGACTPSSTELCLNANRFRVSVNWSTTDGRSGQGQTIPLTDDTGHFWFFGSTNVELVVKVLDGRAINDHFWVFYGALSNVQYTITVVDTETAASRTYTNPQGTLASAADTAAF